MTAPKNVRATSLLAASATIFFIEIVNVLAWKHAFQSADTQAARAAVYFGSLPFHLGSLGSQRITLLALALAGIGATLAFVARRRYHASQMSSAAFIGGNTVVALWLLFILM